jgi:hypothetical protein
LKKRSTTPLTASTKKGEFCGFFDPRLSNFQKKRLYEAKQRSRDDGNTIDFNENLRAIDSVTGNPVSRVSKLAFFLVPHPCKKPWKVDLASSPKHSTPYEAIKTPGPGLRGEPRAEFQLCASCNSLHLITVFRNSGEQRQRNVANLSPDDSYLAVNLISLARDIEINEVLFVCLFVCLVHTPSRPRVGPCIVVFQATISRCG